MHLNFTNYQTRNSCQREEAESALNLFKQIIEGRKEMHDYMTSSLKRGGYNYRKICEVFKINTITIKFYGDEKIRIESPQKIIIFDDHKLQIFELICERFDYRNKFMQ